MQPDDAHKHREHCHNGFARADISLNQPVHQMCRAQIALYLRPDLLLRARQLIGKAVDKILTGVNAHHWGIIDFLNCHIPKKHDRDNKEQEFFKNQTLSG